MSFTVGRAVWKVSRSKGNARLALLALAKHCNEEKIRAGFPALAWPSQSTLAKHCNCSRSTVEEVLKTLVDLGEIEDTGDRRSRGTVVWHVLPAVDILSDDLTEIRSGGDQASAKHPDLTDSREHLTDLPSDLTDSRHDLTDGPVTNKKEQEDRKQEDRTRSPFPLLEKGEDNRDLHPHPATTNNGSGVGAEDADEDQQREILADLEARLPGSKGAMREANERAITQLRGELGSPSSSPAVDEPPELSAEQEEALEEVGGPGATL